MGSNGVDLRAGRLDIALPVDGPLSLSLDFQTGDTPAGEDMTGATAAFYDANGIENTAQAFTVTVGNGNVWTISGSTATQGAAATNNRVTLTMSSADRALVAADRRWNRLTVKDSTGRWRATGTVTHAGHGDGTGTPSGDPVIVSSTDSTVIVQSPSGNAAAVVADDLAAHEALTEAHNISAFGSTLVDDADAATARTTLELGTMAQEAASAYAALAGATFSGDVGIESASPRSHMALSTGGTADRRRLGWILTGSQALLRVETDAGAAVRNFLILDLVTGTFGAGVNTPIDYSAAVHVKMPTPTAATHASRITAYNAATGQIQRDGMEQGDTGWRRVSPINGYTGTFDMKRVGNVVQFRAALLDGSAHTNDRFYAAPSGFRWRPMGAGIESTFSIETGNTLTARGIYQNSYHLWTNAVTASGAACDLMWTTEDAWPSTLPGTQVTAPATLS